MNHPKVEKIITGDGCNSLYVPELDENYHSTHGAYNEAMHVFIKNGLQGTQGNVSVLEIGFGTGLNAWLTALEAQKTKRNITYTSLEKYPLEASLVSTLNYTRFTEEKIEKDLFFSIHSAEWEKLTPITACFALQKLALSIHDFSEKEQYDIIYFDAFGPRKQPNMWTEEVMQRMYDALVPGGFLITYCAQGQVKRNMKAVGFNVEPLPGPPGKREMTKAIKIVR